MFPQNVATVHDRGVAKDLLLIIGFIVSAAARG
jgi:hypothetical protein